MAVQTNQSSRPFLRERPFVLVVRDEPEPASGTHEAGTYGHIAKPFDAKNVANRIAQALVAGVLGENRRRTKSRYCDNSGTSSRMRNRQPNFRLDV